jgi:1-acyl-sn-glycerol-3-phosphate acyltransferase
MTLLRNALTAVVLTVLAFLSIPVILAGEALRRQEWFLAYGAWMMKVGRTLLGIRVVPEGREKLDPARPYVFMCNHLSFLDGPLLVTVLDRPLRFIVKRFVLRIPIMGLGMKSAGFVPLDREGAGEGRKRLAQAARLICDRGYSFLVYPEGTRSLNGALQRLRRGGFFLALESGAPIVPVSIKGTYELMPRVRWRIRGGSVRIVFHEPVDVAGYSEETLPELAERVRAAIASGLASLARPRPGPRAC